MSESKFTLEDQNIIYERFNNKCYKCNSTEQLCLDHHYPMREGHFLSEKNGVILCRSCNSKKGIKMPEDFYTKGELIVLHSIGIKDIIDEEDADLKRKKNDYY